MKAICATDLSAASEATIQRETCLECLGRMGVEEIHLVIVTMLYNSSNTEHSRQ